MKCRIRYGMGGGFGGPGEWESVYVISEKAALDEAYERAKEVYASYEGLHGVLSREDIQEENPDYDDKDIEAAYQNELDSWLDYEAEVITDR